MEPETITERPIAPTERLVRCLYRLSRGDYYYTVAEVTSHGGMKHESGNETHKKFGLQLDSNQNHLVLKRTLNHLAKLTKRLSCVLSTYLYGAFNCMFLSCHICVSEWIHALQVVRTQLHGCFEQWVPWYSGNYRIWIHSEIRTWHDKNIQLNAP